MLRSIRANMRYIFLIAWLVSGAAFAQSDPMQEAIAAYETGDFEKARQLWEPLANQGNAQAQYSVAVLYHKGQGRAEDFSKALEWYRKAAEQDHVNSLFNLGVAYWEGRSVTRDLTEAVRWWRRAAELEYGAAQHNLATAYYLGQGVEKDQQQAVAWFQRAAANGYTRADKALTVIQDKYPQMFATTDTAAPAVPAPPAATEIKVQEPPPQEQTVSMLPVPSVGSPPATSESSATSTSSVRAIDRVGSQGAKAYPFHRETLPTLGEMPPDTPVQVRLQNNDWLYVLRPGGFEMWIYGRYVDGDSGPGTVNESNVRARPLPSTASNSYPLGTFNRGELVEVLEVSGEWKKVRAPERLGAWVRAKDVVRAEETVMSSAPMAEAEATAMAETRETAPPYAARVREQGAKIYPSNRDSLPTLGELPPDSPVRLVLRQGDWVYVQVPGGLEVWVYGRYIDGDGGQGTVTAGDVRARPLPSTARNSYPLGTFNKGESVEVLEVRGEWKKVRAPERLGAWVKGEDVVAANKSDS